MDATERELSAKMAEPPRLVLGLTFILTRVFRTAEWPYRSRHTRLDALWKQRPPSPTGSVSEWP